METGLFEIQADYLHELMHSQQTQPKPNIASATERWARSVDVNSVCELQVVTNETEAAPEFLTGIRELRHRPRTLFFRV